MLRNGKVGETPTYLRMAAQRAESRAKGASMKTTSNNSSSSLSSKCVASQVTARETLTP